MKYRKIAILSLTFIFLFILSDFSAQAEKIGADFIYLFRNHTAVKLITEADTGNIIKANNAAVEFYGYSKNVLETMNINQLIMLNQQEIDNEKTAAANEDRSYFIFPHRLADDTVRIVEVYSYPYEMNGIVLYYHVVLDVTERETAKLSLQHELDRLARAESITALGHFEIDLDTGIVTGSYGAQRIYGLQSNVSTLEEIQAVPLPEYRSELDAELEGLILRNEPYDIRFRIRRKTDGSIAHIHSVAEYNVEENIVFGTIQDITAQVENARVIERQQDIIMYSLAALIFVLLIFIWQMLINFRRRIVAESALSKKLYFENILSSVSSSFVGSSAANLDAKLNETIALLGEKLKVDRCYVTQISQDRNTMTMTHEWCKAGAVPLRQYYVNIPLKNYPWIASRSNNGQFIDIPNVELLPEEASAEREHLLSLGVKGILTVPINYLDMIAHLGFDLSQTDRPWSSEEMTFLRLLSNILSDALEKNSMENSLFNDREKMRITISSVGDGIIATDGQGIIEIINPIAQNLTGWREDEAIGKNFDEVFSIINEYTREPMENPVNKVLETGHIIGLANHTLLLTKDGREIAVADSAAPIRDSAGDIHGVVLVFRDVTEEQKNIKHIEYLSLHDQLTGLYNRRYYETELKRLDNQRNLPISIIVADLNGLKLTNDAFGHEAGDNLIKKAAEIMKDQCRTDEIIARIGGDEFVILLPKTNSSETQQIVRRIQKKFKENHVGSVALSVSMGWSCKENPEVEMTSVFKQAERFMYQQKLLDSQSMRGTTVYTIIRALYEKNRREEEHSRRVSEINAAIGTAMGLDESAVEVLRNVGILHDIGKIGVPDAILNKPGELTADERLEIQRHAEIGYRILSSLYDMSEIADYVLAHHERWDGRGYPKGLSKEEIPLQARITAVANVYDSLMTDRPYRRTLTKEETIEEIKKHAGTQFDPEVVRIFVKMMDDLADQNY